MKKLLPNLLLMLVAGAGVLIFKDKLTFIDSRHVMLMVLVIALVNVVILQKENKKLKTELLELKK